MLKSVVLLNMFVETVIDRKLSIVCIAQNLFEIEDTIMFDQFHAYLLKKNQLKTKNMASEDLKNIVDSHIMIMIVRHL